MVITSCRGNALGNVGEAIFGQIYLFSGILTIFLFSEAGQLGADSTLWANGDHFVLFQDHGWTLIFLNWFYRQKAIPKF